MKYTVLKCNCCGEEFFTEYYAGGYIDHCMNFSDQFDRVIKQEENEICEEIYYDGITIRETIDIKKRRNCFKKFCEHTNNIQKFERVDVLLSELLKRHEFLDTIHDTIYELVKDLTEEEKQYIGLKYQEYDCKTKEDEE